MEAREHPAPLATFTVTPFSVFEAVSLAGLESHREAGQ